MNAIYLLTCDNSKNYVGVSQEPIIRIRNHLSGNGSRLVKEALERGASFISTILLEDSNISNLYNEEAYYIDKYNALNPLGYNLDKGGRQGGVADRKGSKNTRAILTEEQILEIRNIYSLNSRYTQQILSSMYGVSRENISAIVTGKSWSNIGGPITIKRNSDIKLSDHIIELIKFLRREDRLTYKQIAEELNIGVSTAAKYGSTL